MSKELTEQWKKGELTNGWYWVKSIRVKGIYAYTAEYLNNRYRPINNERIIEKVPTYEKYQALLSDQLAKNEAVEINAELEAENKKLKELLKECRPYIALYTENNKHIGFTPETANLLQRIKEVLK